MFFMQATPSNVPRLALRRSFSAVFAAFTPSSGCDLDRPVKQRHGVLESRSPDKTDADRFRVLFEVPDLCRLSA